ncbi:MAG: cell envelope integrity protein CreD [Chitinophagaceae bacterium]|nr:MAG: cell envelope integrity protein CreD [Chitinophagaceae bacterium]
MEQLPSESAPKSKILVKISVVAAIILVLLLPAWKVEQLVMEREARQKEAVDEVCGKWAGSQLLGGPVLVLPYLVNYTNTEGKPVQSRHYAYFLPGKLDMKTVAQPQERHRGIYKVMLYSAQVQLSGQFDRPDLGALRISPEQVLWGEAFVRLQLSDVGGLNEELTLTWNGDRRLVFAPNTSSDPYSSSSLAAPLPLQGPMELAAFTFNGALQVNGSQQLLFAPLGKTTTVELQSTWPHPSFTGTGLPQQSSITDKGFRATWRSLAHRRNFPQQFKDDDRINNSIYDLTSSSFGVDLFVPVNAYQKTLRSVKYCLLCIVLTFTAFFLIEVVNKRSVHPFQYGLIGLALVLFYALLLSFSEYIGFNYAYALAAAATVGLIGWFVKGLLQSGRLSTLLSAVLVLLYGYVFTILELQDFALLLGSLGLFLTLAIVMYFSRKINW